ncbi:hypothetical protein EMPS_06516 [Entomortierella parvispora]|uniref:DDE Tnp4 domain-containing protein n=1 Tax=Entomortierella parvispora TaxID=205924 RepID=A0A9P3HCV9_9FUNG|nr:hypothetical protein EMPS_06516 [Entomortierella parvispora]
MSAAALYLTYLEEHILRGDIGFDSDSDSETDSVIDARDDNDEKDEEWDDHDHHQDRDDNEAQAQDGEDIYFGINCYSDEQCKKLFRFKSYQLWRIVRALKIPPQVQTKHGDSATAMEALCMSLYRLASTNEAYRMTAIFDYTEDAMTRITDAFLQWVVAAWDNVLEWDHCRLTPAKLEEFVQACSQKGQAPNIFGFLDRASLQLGHPFVDQGPRSKRRRREPITIHFQGIVAPDGIIVHLGLSVWGYRPKFEKIQQREIEGTLARFVGPPQGKGLSIHNDGKSQKGPQIARCIHKNQCTCAVIVEQAFNNVTYQFPSLDLMGVPRLLVSPLETQYRAAVLFANIHACLFKGGISDHFGMRPPTVEEYLNPKVFNPAVLFE